MNTATLQFLGFAAVAAGLYNLNSSIAWRQVTLALANLLFLATFATSPGAFLPLLGFLALGYLGIQVAGKVDASLLFWAVVLLLITAFVWLKKYAFLPSHSYLQFTYLTVGLSYILFRVLHVMIDSHSGNLSGKITLISYLNYTLSFMTLVSGPIERYEDFAATQLAPVRPRLSIFSLGEGLHRVAVGFSKVAVLSWLCSLLQKEAIRALPGSGLFREKILIGAAIAVLYPLYLYFNFSGYTDMMIGIGRFFRFTLPENFDRPFAADNIMNFWNRWHMTLTNWLKTYVFNPLLLALMRRVTSPTWESFLVVPALFVTFFLIGLWHGQTTEFLMFGFLQGLGIAINQLYRILLERRLGKGRFKTLNCNPVYVAISRGLTFTWFTFTLLWFWTSWQELKRMFHILGFRGFALCFVLILVLSTVLLSLSEVLRETLLRWRWNGSAVLDSRYSRTVFDTCMVLASLVVVVLLNAPAPEIIYKAF